MYKSVTPGVFEKTAQVSEPDPTHTKVKFWVVVILVVIGAICGFFIGSLLLNLAVMTGIKLGAGAGLGLGLIGFLLIA